MPRWVCFDLDDTLHDFRHASQQAIQAVVDALLVAHANTLTADCLHAEYAAICRRSVAGFTDGRRSSEYRRERFTELLTAFDLPLDSLTSLLEVYDHALTSAYRLAPDALETLTELRSRAIDIAVISEGTHDAQQRVLAGTGLGEYVDLLMTSNAERITKRDGLFVRFLERTRTCAADAVVVGDSVDNDVMPAREAGIEAVLYAPEGAPPHAKPYRVISGLRDLVRLLPST